ncbi:hypothetical protein RhiirC2_801930, partial [Rhizophagus irregularis]
VEANFEESEAELELVNFENTEFIDPEDLQGVSLDDAIDVVDGKPTPERVVKWPNDAYCDFLELIVEGNISNKIDFKENVVATYNEINFTLYYLSLFRTIQALLQRPEVANNFVHKGIQNKMKDDRGETKIFGELFKDATTFNGLGKSSGHPVFLTLGNIPKRVQNLLEAKILLGFLPKVQDTGIKTTE